MPVLLLHRRAEIRAELLHAPAVRLLDGEGHALGQGGKQARLPRRQRPLGLLAVVLAASAAPAVVGWRRREQSKGRA